MMIRIARSKITTPTLLAIMATNSPVDKPESFPGSEVVMAPEELVTGFTLPLTSDSHIRLTAICICTRACQIMYVPELLG